MHQLLDRGRSTKLWYLDCDLKYCGRVLLVLKDDNEDMDAERTFVDLSHFRLSTPSAVFVDIESITLSLDNSSFFVDFNGLLLNVSFSMSTTSLLCRILTRFFDDFFSSSSNSRMSPEDCRLRFVFVFTFFLTSTLCRKSSTFCRKLSTSCGNASPSGWGSSPMTWSQISSTSFYSKRSKKLESLNYITVLILSVKWSSFLDLLPKKVCYCLPGVEWFRRLSLKLSSPCCRRLRRP